MNHSEAAMRVPISAATQRGVSWLNETASDRRVLLTRFGRVTSVVDSAERLDETARQVGLAGREVVESFAAGAGGRAGQSTLGEVCDRLGLSEDRVRARSRELSGLGAP